MLREVNEGKAVLLVHFGTPSKRLEVFYNPAKREDRDTAVAFLSTYFKGRSFSAADLLSGSGVLGIRLILEAGAGFVLFNDINPKAVELIRRNLKLNNIDEDEYRVENRDARALAYEEESTFDYVDIDPFGSPLPFLLPALNIVRDKGLLGVVATDTAPLVGNAPRACRRKYGSNPLRCGEEKEVGIRILIKRCVELAAIEEVGLFPLFCYPYKHIFRVFFLVRKGRKWADKALDNIGYLRYNKETLEREFAKEYSSYGPLWIGNIFSEVCKDLPDINRICRIAREECTVRNDNLHYCLTSIASAYKIGNMPKISEIISGLKQQGYSASRTVFNDGGIRTDASLENILGIVEASIP